MPYEKMWSAANPGCLIILVDQSGSMADNFGNPSSANQRKCDMTATIINNVLDEFIRTNTLPPDNVRPRADIAVIGYEGSTVGSALAPPLDAQPLASLRDLAANPLRVENRKTQKIDPAGNLYEENQALTIWVEPVAGGGTPMCAALRRAREIASDWAASHLGSYPPVVVHITDGASGDGDPTGDAQQLMQVSTNDGSLLLFNCHITDGREALVEFPASEAGIPANAYAKMLFNMSSEIPDQARAAFLNSTQRDLVPGTRGYIFNGDAVSIRKMLTFGSTAAGLETDPNR